MTDERRAELLAAVEALHARFDELAEPDLDRLASMLDELDLDLLVVPVVATLTVSMVPQEGDDWIFTFGPAHHHPETGAPLGDRYIRFRQTSWREARRKMLARFGDKWSHQSPGSDAEMFEREYDTWELPEAEWPREKAGSVPADGGEA